MLIPFSPSRDRVNASGELIRSAPARHYAVANPIMNDYSCQGGPDPVPPKPCGRPEYVANRLINDCAQLSKRMPRCSMLVSNSFIIHEKVKQ